MTAHACRQRIECADALPARCRRLRDPLIIIRSEHKIQREPARTGVLACHLGISEFHVRPLLPIVVYTTASKTWMAGISQGHARR